HQPQRSRRARRTAEKKKKRQDTDYTDDTDLKKRTARPPTKGHEGPRRPARKTTSFFVALGGPSWESPVFILKSVLLSVSSVSSVVKPFFEAENLTIDGVC